MKTIEERAKEYAPDPVGSNYILYTQAEYIVNQQRNAYIAGATDQKTIDNDKAKEAFNKACGWLSYYSWFNEAVEKFMKMIEE